jgi:hypothetical protein
MQLRFRVSRYVQLHICAKSKLSYKASNILISVFQKVVTSQVTVAWVGNSLLAHTNYFHNFYVKHFYYIKYVAWIQVCMTVINHIWVNYVHHMPANNLNSKKILPICFTLYIMRLVTWLLGLPEYIQKYIRSCLKLTCGWHFDLLCRPWA